MIGVNTAPSLGYLLGMDLNQSETMGFVLTPRVRTSRDKAIPEGTGQPSYIDYLGGKASDILSAPPIWVGGFAETLGLKPGSEAAPEAIAALCHGMDPRTGKPLTDNKFTVAEKIAATMAVEAALEKQERAVQKLVAARLAVIDAGGDLDAMGTDSKVIAAQEAVDKAGTAVKSARGNKANQQNGTDITFGPPKSVSVLWAASMKEGLAGDKVAAARAAAIEQAGFNAVKKTIEKYIEPQMVFTRVREGNKDRQFENAKGIATAVFRHPDARPTSETIDDPTSSTGQRQVLRLPDPHLHWHALLMMIGQDQDDNVRSLWTTFISEHAHGIGAAFRAELAHELRAMGLAVSPDEQENVKSFRLTGVTDEVSSEFSARRAQVLQNLAAGFGNEAAALLGRETKGAYTGADLIADWGRRFDEMGLTSQAIAEMTNAKLADFLAREDLALQAKAGKVEWVEGDQAWAAALDKRRQQFLNKLDGEAPTVDAAVEQLMDMEAAFTMTDIIRVSFEASQFCHRDLASGETPLEWAERFRGKILSHPELKNTYGCDKFKRPQFTSRRLIQREKALYYSKIPKLTTKRTDVLSLEDVEKAIVKFERMKTDQGGSPFKLRDFQKDMVRGIAAGHGSIHFACAPAGCGKTTLALAAVIAFEDAGGRLFSLAPSNAAAQNLAKDLGKARSDGIPPQQLLSWIKSGRVLLTSKDVLFIDEASLLDLDTADRLVEAALNASGGSARIVFMGDPKQLPSVGRGNFLQALTESSRFDHAAPLGERVISRASVSAADWTNISRQASDLGKQATGYFAIGQTAKGLEIYERSGALQLMPDSASALNRMVHEAYLPLAGRTRDYQAAREEREARYIAFAETAGKRASELSLDIGQAINAGAFEKRKASKDPEADFVASFPASERAQARQWIEDRNALLDARSALLKGYADTLMLATRRTDVNELNKAARKILKEIGALGGIDGKQVYQLPRGELGLLEICEGERLRFTAKAKTGSLKFARAGDSAPKSTVGTVIAIRRTPKGVLELVMELDGQKGSRVLVDTSQYTGFNWSYASTAHTAQGMTCGNVYEYVSKFAGQQTGYVSETRHRDALKVFGVMSEYEVYKKNVAEALVKTDAKDLTFAAEQFGSTPSELEALQKQLDEGEKQAHALAERLEASRLGSIAQGLLVEFGAAPLGFKEGQKPSYFAKIDVGGRELVLWGEGLMAELARVDASPGMRMGLEALEGKNALGHCVAWKAHTEAELASAGLLLDDAGLTKRARSLIKGRTAADREARDAISQTVASTMLSPADAEALAKANIARAATTAAQRAAELGALTELGRFSTMPEDIEERLKQAARALPYAKSNDDARIRGDLAAGIHLSKFAVPVLKSKREWLALDDKMAYCRTDWGQIEAWSRESLPNPIIEEALGTGGTIDKLLERRERLFETARKVALEPVQQALGKLGGGLQIFITEHPKHGLCLGINATVRGTHKDEPFKILFAGSGAFGTDASQKVGGLGGAKHCKGYDRDAGLNAWIYKIDMDATGQPYDKQIAVDEIVAIGQAQGHNLIIETEWDRARQKAWTAIEARMLGPWGKIYAKEADPLAGYEAEGLSPKAFFRALPKRQDDIVRWNAKILGGADTAEEWTSCSDLEAGQRHLPQYERARLPDNQRRFEGLIMHADDHDVFVQRGQRIMALERSLLGLEGGAAADLIGQWAAIGFAKGRDPQLESIEAPKLISRAKEIERRIDEGKEIDAAKASPEAQAAFERAGLTVAALPDEVGLAWSWALRESRELQEIKARRAEGLTHAKAATAHPIESFSGGITARKAFAKSIILEEGRDGVLFQANNQAWLISRADADKALAKHRGSRIGVKVNLSLAPDEHGRMKVNTTGVNLAPTAGRVLS